MIKSNLPLENFRTYKIDPNFFFGADNLKMKSANANVQMAMLKINPIYIPRNHLVESVIHQAMQENNFSKMRELLELIREPYKEKKSKNTNAITAKQQQSAAITDQPASLPIDAAPTRNQDAEAMGRNEMQQSESEITADSKEKLPATDTPKDPTFL